MSFAAQESYLTNQVMTASPQKLRLMLIDGALRFATAAKKHWEAEQNSQAEDALTRCRKIVVELLCSAASAEGDIPNRVAGIYTFVMQTLTQARLDRDISKLDEVIKVLGVERETWKAICDQSEEPSAASSDVSSAKLSPHILQADRPAIPDLDMELPPQGGFSMEI